MSALPVLLSRLGVLGLSLLACGCTEPDVSAVRATTAPGEAPCMLAGTQIPLLGGPGDSPLVAVTLHGQPAAMFFSPGFAPVLFRRNGGLWFPHGRTTDLQTQDGGYNTVWDTHLRDFAIGPLEPAPIDGLVLPGRETRSVDGRPIIGVVGRDALVDDAVVDLDIPRRRVVLAVLRKPRCPAYRRLLDGSPMQMRRDLLSVMVSVNGHAVRAVLEPDLPVSVIPTPLAAGLGVADEGGHSVRTEYGARVRGRRERVALLVIGETRLHDVAFDVEDGVDQVMLGLDIFARGEAVFDFEAGQFWFHLLTDHAPPPTGLHFNETRVAHTAVQ